MARLWALGVVAGLGGAGAGGVPKVGPVRLVDAGPRAQDVDTAKLAAGDVEEVRERGPRGHVRLDEEGARLLRVGGAGRVLGDEPLGLGPEGEVGEDDVAVAGQEECREGEVDA